MKVFLLGYMGSGKSTLGRELAKHMGLDFMDMDQVISEGMGMDIPSIFDTLGEDVFRDIEHDFLVSLQNKDGLVVSAGGGSPCFHDNMALMNEQGITAYLKQPEGVLVHRLIRSKTKRPLIQGKNESELANFITGHLAGRVPFYNQARIILEGPDIGPEEACNRIRQLQ